jgi:hypothetical protein
MDVRRERNASTPKFNSCSYPQVVGVFGFTTCDSHAVWTCKNIHLNTAKQLLGLAEGYTAMGLKDGARRK